MPLVLTVLLAVLYLVRGVLHPELNFDLIPYTALAKEMRGAGGKPEAYQELATRVGAAKFQIYVSGSYRARMYADDGFFEANLPFYRIRPLYILLCSIVGLLIGSDVAATYVIAAVANALAVLLSYAIAGVLGWPAGAWRLSVPLSWAAAGGLAVAELSTPDALAVLLGLVFIWTAIAPGAWTAGRAVWLILLGCLMVAARTETILLLGCLSVSAWFFEPRCRRVALLIFVPALATYLAIQHWSGNWGYIALLNFALLDGSHEIVPHLALNPARYIRTLAHGLMQILGEDHESTLLTLAVCLLAVVWFREYRLRESQRGLPTGDSLADRSVLEFDPRVLILSGGLLLFLVAHFVLFPAPWVRHMEAGYVLAGILFARSASWFTVPRG